MDTLPHEKQIRDYEQTILRLREDGRGPALLSTQELGRLEKKLEQLKRKVYSELTPVQRLAICRHPSRPKTLDYIRELCEDFVELYGDRCVGDDPALVGGLAKIGGQKFVVIGQEKGHDTTSRLHRNFGMLHPEGFRKALRLMQLGAKFNLPVICFVDTPGAYPGLTAEERGQAWAIANNLREMARIRTPIIVVLIGEAGSGGALAIAIGDSIGMLEHGYYSVISPEGCASILWKDSDKKHLAAEALKLNAENMLEFEVVDAVIREPLGGAHHDVKMASQNVLSFIMSSWNRLKMVPTDLLLEQRYRKFRKLGSYSEETLT